MHFDIQEYNKQVVSSEKQMLLYNIALLHDKQPPHFMMLSSVAQTRTFSANASFQWTDIFNSLTIYLTSLFTSITPVTKGTNAYEVGPFTAGAVENPTITFVPIQGPDFAQRFESSLTDKLTYFLEDERWYETPDNYESLFLLFAQSLILNHGDRGPGGKCSESQLFNLPASYQDFKDCIDEILYSPQLVYTVIDANRKIPSTATLKDPPTATEAISALEANLKWAKSEGPDKVDLVNPIRMPAYFDYQPDFTGTPAPTASPTAKERFEEVSPVWWHQTRRPDWQRLAYRLPPNYQWYEWKGHGYVLIPEDDVMAFKEGEGWSPRKREERPAPDPFVQMSYGDKIVSALWPLQQDFFYVELRRNVASVANLNTRFSAGTLHLGHAPILSVNEIVSSAANQTGKSKLEYKQYKDFTVDFDSGVVTAIGEQQGGRIEPDQDVKVSFDYPIHNVDDTQAAEECFPDTLQPSSDQNDVVCGYFKIGNLFAIMKRLGDMACTTDNKKADGSCPDYSFVEIGSKVPSWAANWAPYGSLGSRKWIWEPAHGPDQKAFYERDKFMFLTLYKVYQLSLVDTSKLVTGAVPITISK